MSHPKAAAPQGAPNPLSSLSVKDLKSKAHELKIDGADGMNKADLIAAIDKALSAGSEPESSTEPPQESGEPKELLTPETPMDKFQEGMTSADAVMPSLVSDEQYKWLKDMGAELGEFVQDPDTSRWSRPVDPVPDASTGTPPEDPTAAIQGAPTPPPINITIETEPLPDPLDISLETFVELMTSGENPVPPALTDEQRDWLRSHTVFNDEIWHPGADGIWRREITDGEPREPFELEDLDFELDPVLVEKAVQGWLVTEPIEGTVEAYSEDGWREATVNEDGSARITFLANVQRHDRSPGFRDSYDVTLRVESLDLLILALVGLRQAALGAQGLEE